jgi:hypothetical protein
VGKKLLVEKDCWPGGWWRTEINKVVDDSDQHSTTGGGGSTKMITVVAGLQGRKSVKA